MSKLIVETTRVGEVPVLTVAQKGDVARPIVFAMHGFTQLTQSRRERRVKTVS